MTAALQALIALQQIDSAADAARKRQAELPALEAAAAERLRQAETEADAARAKLTENHVKRRALEKDVAGVDSRLSRFNDHKAAVKTNQEYTALLHEIDTAKAEKDAIEEKILVLMEDADRITAEIKAAEAGLAGAKRDVETTRTALATESTDIEAELARLAGTRTGEARAIDATLLARYEQLLRGRKGIAVAAMTGETCSACFVRLRPHVAQQVRRNDEIIQCESCQRILYYVQPIEGA